VQSLYLQVPLAYVLMDQSPEQAGTLLHHNEGNFSYYFPNINTIHSSFFEDAISHNEDPGTKYGGGDAADQRSSSANDFYQFDMANSSLDAQRTSTGGPRHSNNLPSNSGNNSDARRGQGNFMAISSPSSRYPDTRGDSLCAHDSPSELHNLRRKSPSLRNSPAALMHSTTFPSSPHISPPQIPAGTSKYAPFQNRFESSATAKNFRHTSMRFDRVPWKAPEEDATINEVEINRSRHVERIYNAMVRGDIARDNEGSTAMKRWVYDANYPSALVEAYSHKVFDAMLEQVKLGFRGWNQNDYVVDERKGEDDDRDVDCAARLDNIVTALEYEKSICENVMSSSNQIRMFVNAPKAYSKRKNQNRVGNGKRPNAKGLVTGRSGTPSTKKRKTVGVHARNRSSTLSDVLSPRGDMPHEPHEPSNIPYFTTPAAFEKVALSPQTSPNSHAHLAPATHTPASRTHCGLIGHYDESPVITSISPHASHAAPAVLPQNPPFKSPHNLRTSHFFSSSPTTGNVPESCEWPQLNSFHEPMPREFELPSQIDHDLLINLANWEQQASPFTANLSTTNLFAKNPDPCVPMLNHEGYLSQQVEGVDGDDTGDFMSFWQQQNGVQPFSFHDPQSAWQDRP